MDDARQPNYNSGVRREVIDGEEYRAGRNTVGDGLGSGSIELCDFATSQPIARVVCDGASGKLTIETFSPVSRATIDWLFDEAGQSLG